MTLVTLQAYIIDLYTWIALSFFFNLEQFDATVPYVSVATILACFRNLES